MMRTCDSCGVGILLKSDTYCDFCYRHRREVEERTKWRALMVVCPADTSYSVSFEEADGAVRSIYREEMEAADLRRRMDADERFVERCSDFAWWMLGLRDKILAILQKRE